MPERQKPACRRLVPTAACALLALVASWALPSARAAMLEAEECSKLKAEQGELNKAGVRGHLAKGPEWAKTNLGADGLERVRRLIAVEEEIAFRCPRPPPPKPDVAEGGKAAPKTKVKAAKVETKDTAVTDAADVKAKPKPKPKPAAAEAGAEPKSAPKPAPPKSAPKPKSDDAYSPTNSK